VIGAILRNLCPACRQGKVFRGIYSMNEACPQCGQSFAREPGYFLGAMMVGYFIGAMALVPTVVLGLWVFELPFGALMLIAGLQVLLLNPIIFRVSRLAWIHAEHRITRNLTAGRR
jgi:uncharacterized protein (DUF983 family)